MEKKILFIYNPKSGKAQIKNRLLDIIDIFVKGGYEVIVYPTQYAGDAVNVTVRKMGEYDLLVCSGGDGTLGEVVAGMMQCEHKVPIGYIPSGSTNDFANSLHISKKMDVAARKIVNGKAFPCDVGFLNNNSFVYIAGFGVFTDVSYETNQNIKNVLGHMAYVLEGMRRLPSVKSYQMKVFYEENVIEGDFIFGMVTNSLSVGGFKRITGKNVELDDGVFEVTLIKRPSTAAQLNDAIAALMIRDIDARFMYCFKTNHIVFESDEEIAWTLDGEFGGMHKIAEIVNNRQAVEIVI